MAGTKFPVKLFYDIISPYSWLAFESLCKYRGLWTKMDLILKPCSIALLFKESGNPPPLFNPLKAAYVAKDCSRAQKIFDVSNLMMSSRMILIISLIQILGSTEVSL